METLNGRDALVCRRHEVEDPISERRLWAAVLAQALEDWRGDRIRASQEAEEFLLEDHQDFETVCAGAGIDPSSFRARLHRLRCLRPTPQQLKFAA